MHVFIYFLGYGYGRVGECGWRGRGGYVIVWPSFSSGSLTRQTSLVRINSKQSQTNENANAGSIRATKWISPKQDGRKIDATCRMSWNIIAKSRMDLVFVFGLSEPFVAVCGFDFVVFTAGDREVRSGVISAGNGERMRSRWSREGERHMDT